MHSRWRRRNHLLLNLLWLWHSWEILSRVGHSCLTVGPLLIIVELSLLLILASTILRNRCQNGHQINDVSLRERILLSSLSLENTFVTLLFMTLFSGLPRLTELSFHPPIIQDQIRGLLCHLSRLTVHKADEADVSIRDQLRASDLTKATEKAIELFLGQSRVNISDDQVEELHTSLELIGFPFKIVLSLLL